MSITEAEEKISVLLTTVNGEKEVAESTAKKEVIEFVNAETTKMSSKKVEIDQWSIIQEMKAKTSFETAKNRYEAMLLEAEAESKAIEGIQANRKQELKLEYAKAITELAGNSSMLVSGDAGEEFMKSLLKIDLDDITKD